MNAGDRIRSLRHSRSNLMSSLSQVRCKISKESLLMIGTHYSVRSLAKIKPTLLRMTHRNRHSQFLNRQRILEPKPGLRGSEKFSVPNYSIPLGRKNLWKSRWLATNRFRIHFRIMEYGTTSNRFNDIFCFSSTRFQILNTKESWADTRTSPVQVTDPFKHRTINRAM